MRIGFDGHLFMDFQAIKKKESHWDSFFRSLYRYRFFRSLRFLRSLLGCPPFGHGFAIG